MIITNLQQGSEEWKSERLTAFTASEAAAMMGNSKVATRTELLRLKKTGFEKEIGDYVEKFVFKKGHETEALARPIIERITGEEFYPVVGYVEIDGMKLLASFDGLNMMEDSAFEHKQWNADLVEAVRAEDLPASHYWQLEHQLLVSGAERVIFVVSDGTEQNMVFMEYCPVPGRRERLIAGWKQFAKDLAEYTPEPEVLPATAEPVMALPALSIQVGGAISIQSNLDRFGERLKTFIGETNAAPETDQDFANLEQACKILKEAEDALKQAESNALAQTSTVDEMRRTVAYLADMARTNRLKFEKLVKSEKENRKYAIVMGAADQYGEHCKALQSELPVKFNAPTVNFSDAVKGKKTLSSMQDSVNTMLANSKIDADALAKELRDKHAWYIENGSEYAFLFSDMAQIIYKERDDFERVVTGRIAEHKEQERIKAEQATKEQAEREERIRIEAEEKAKREAAEREEKIRQEAAEAERKRIEQENKEKALAEKQLELGTVVEQPAKLTPAERDEAVVDQHDVIGAFMHSRDFGKDENKIRAALVEFVKFQSGFQAKEAA